MRKLSLVLGNGIKRKMTQNKYLKVLIFVLTILSIPLSGIVFSIPPFLLVFSVVSVLLVHRYPKTFILVLPILFLGTLYVNNLLTINFKEFEYSFDLEKIVVTNPNYLKLIDRYWHEDLWLPFRIRNVFYTPLLMFFGWIDLVFKLLSPVFLIRVMGYSGLFLTALGVYIYVSEKSKKWWPLFWSLTVVFASGLGMLVDSKKALILAFPAIMYFVIKGIFNKKFDSLWKYWLILFLIDFILK